MSCGTSHQNTAAMQFWVIQRVRRRQRLLELYRRSLDAVDVLMEHEQKISAERIAQTLGLSRPEAIYEVIRNFPALARLLHGYARLLGKSEKTLSAYDWYLKSNIA